MAKNMFEDNKYFTSIDILKKLKDNNICVSKRTIINVLHEMDGQFKIPQNKPLLTDKHIEDRLKWCEMWKDYKNWKNVKFTDECTIFIQKEGERWIFKNINDYDMSVKHSYKINIWGSISVNFKREIYLFTEILTGEKYIEILKNHCKINKFTIFQDDNDPKHRSAIVLNWKKKNNITSINWPSNSPDLNPIENIWHLLKTDMKKINYLNVKEFKESILKCWNTIDQNFINNAINSIPKRILNVIEKNGKTIDY